MTKISNGVDELIDELKKQGVLQSPELEAAFRHIDRKDFVRPEDRWSAYENHPLEIGAGQTISQPYTVAFMLGLLDPKPRDRILDVGAGSGWQTALLAHIVSQEIKGQKAKGKIIAIERIPELCQFAKENLKKYGFVERRIIELRCGDATDTISGGPFDKIIAAAASTRTTIPESWRRELAVGGKIIAPIGNSIWLFTKRGKDQWDEREFPGFAFVPLVGTDTEYREYKEHREDKNRKALQSPRTYFILSILFIFLVLSVGAYTTFAPLTLPHQRVSVEIQPGMGSRMIGAFLKTHGVIRSKWAFVSYATLTGKASQLKPGTYEFDGSTTIPAVIRQLVEGEHYPNERFITIPEGWDLKDIDSYFASVGVAAPQQFFATAGYPPADAAPKKMQSPIKNFSEQFLFLRELPPGATLEGYLYPDTYRVYRDATIDDVIRKMLANFGEKLTPELRNEIGVQKKTLFEIITMASLLEKEVPGDEDRKMVAGILWKRLDAGIPLQVDATVNYAVGKSGALTTADLASPSPYNTYRVRGLPPGPIDNPGIEAVRAALFPTENPYLYYLSTPDGHTIFSKTLDEHIAAKAKYLK